MYWHQVWRQSTRWYHIEIKDFWELIKVFRSALCSNKLLRSNWTSIVDEINILVGFAIIRSRIPGELEKISGRSFKGFQIPKVSVDDCAIARKTPICSKIVRINESRSTSAQRSWSRHYGSANKRFFFRGHQFSWGVPLPMRSTSVFVFSSMAASLPEITKSTESLQDTCAEAYYVRK